jgi:hypothetical protein
MIGIEAVFFTQDADKLAKEWIAAPVNTLQLLLFGVLQIDMPPIDAFYLEIGEQIEVVVAVALKSPRRLS